MSISRRLFAASLSVSFIALLTASGLLAGAPLAYAQQQIVAGQNVNMVGGPWSYDPATGRIVGDPFLQRQNEPSLALSSRNPCHILAGANDYRTVDVPGLAGDTETGDAWLGVMKSIDCGQSWTSTLLPGYPQDTSAQGSASPLKGLGAGADPTVRPGPGGIFYYSGVAFNRGSNIGRVFVARFLDRNNKEQGDPIRYVSTARVDSGTSGQFLDKPWVAVDIPRGAGTCTVDGQVVPAAPVYLVYTTFVGGTNNPHSKIMFSKSTNCGTTWSTPSKLSERFALNQGTVLAIDPRNGDIYVAWREFADPALVLSNPMTPQAILFAKSSDGGRSFSKAVAIDSALLPFDQPSTQVSFRSNAYPTMAVDGDGRIYVAWAARGFSASSPDPVSGDARIVMSTSDDGGLSWSMPRSVVDNYLGAGHQIMPALTFAAGKLVIAYYDFRDDVAQVFGRYVNESEAASLAGKRHTIELRAAMADPAVAPVFTNYTSVTSPGSAVPSTQVSNYLFGNLDRGGSLVKGVQLQYNPPNLPLFKLGTVPFIGDYIDIAGQTFTLDANRDWRFNTEPDPEGKRLPLFHVSWTDNRDVRRPPAGQTWANYKSPTLGPTGQVCDPGSNPGSRNQNVYTAPLMPGLVVTAPGNQKNLGQIQRAFVVYVRNTTYADHYYTLSIGPTPSGSFASFTRIDELQLPNGPLATTLTSIYIPRRSSIARSVFIVAPSGTPYPPVSVDVSELAAGGAVQASATVVLNPDIANPDIANPDIANPDIANPDIANAEVYNPDIANVMVNNPDIANPDIANPDIANPDIANPDIANATVANPDIANPDIANPDIANPDIANPDIANPDIANPDIANYSVTDVTWTVKNKGNTTAAYAFRAKLGRTLPEGAKLQLIVRRVYIAPQANPLNECGPPVPAVQNQVLVNIPNPNLNADLTASFDPADYQDNASFYLLPADEGRVTLRLFCPKGDGTCPATLAQARSLAAARVEAQAPNNCPSGSTSPNCQVNGFNPDDIYDTTPPATACSVTTGATTSDCSQGPFYVQGSAVVRLTPADSVGVKTTSCTIDGQPCAGLTFTVAGEGTHAVTFGSTDYAGNSETPQTVAIHVDTTAPVVSGLVFPGAPNLGQWISAPSITGTVNATDSSPLTVSCSDLLNGTTVNGLNITVAGDGAHQVVCSVTDGAGNASVASATVKLDKTNPTVSVPTVVVVAEATSASGAAVSYSVSGADTLSGVTVVCTPPAGSTFPLSTTPTLVSCTATDGAGNTATDTFTVSVKDTTAPALTVPPPIAVEAAGPSGTVVIFGASASDAVTVGVTPVCAPASGATFAIGATTVTCTATDLAGNTGTASFTVAVGDSIAPVVTVPAPIAVEAAGPSGTVVTYAASASDAVTVGVAPVCAPASGATFAIGATTVACTATDAAGNSTSRSFTATVRDTTPPALTVPSPITVEPAGPTGTDVTYVASASDAVGGAITPTCAPASGTRFAVGTTTTVTCTATDPAGNSASRSFTVTVKNDTVAPTVTAVVSPLKIWSPNGAMVPITLSGVVTDAGSGPGTVRYSVKDEYGTVQPNGGPIATNGDGSYAFQVVLQASRKGSDKNGRTYTFTVTATDKAGMTATKVLVVTAVEHNQ